MDLLDAPSLTEAAESFIAALYENVPSEIPRPRVSEWAEENRVLPRGLTPYPGPFSFEMMPYLREIADAMSDSSTVHEVAVMKGTQIGATVGLGENWMGYKIGIAPSPMVYVTGDAGMAETQMELRIDALINSSGLAEKIASQSKRGKQRKSGDVKTRKEFPGGFLVAMGPNSGPKLRSMSYECGYVDELDGFRSTTVGHEGDVLQLIRRRFDAFTETYKILWTSTPLIEQTSLIARLYHEGDQRKYYVPCKHCGHMQPLTWKQLKFERDEDYRLVCTMDRNGRIIESSVRYSCEKCGGLWENADKDWFIPRGEWRPTATPRRPGMRSYHVPGLLSPVGLRSWEAGVIDFLEIVRKGKPKDEFQNWVNTFLGEPFVDEGEKPRIEALLTRERRYHVNELPADAAPLLVTIGADIQQDRIECEIVAWGRDAQSWSVDYRVFPGDTADSDAECWYELRATITEEHAGMHAVLTGIDAGYRTDVVYRFADSFEAGVHPVMGYDTLGRGASYLRLNHVDDAATARIDLNTDLLKQRVYEYLNKSRYEDGRTPVGYCNFPVEYGREHYNRLTAESRILKGQGNQQKIVWDSGGARNEQLDCRVYALGMLYAYKQYTEAQNGLNPGELPWSDFWDLVDFRDTMDK